MCFSAVDINLIQDRSLGGGKPVYASPAAAQKSGEWDPEERPAARPKDHTGETPQFIVGIVKLAPSLMPDGQRAVTVLVRV